MTTLTSFDVDRASWRAAEPRRVAPSTWRAFGIWTAVFWGATGVFGALFYLGVLDFPTSTKASLYGISIWLNGWIIPLLLPGARTRPRLQRFHECLVLWMVSYVMTNLLWEIPWVIFSPFVFHDLHTLNDIAAYTPWMRENVLHMYWWDLASFGSVDLRTVNHNPTFFTLEMYAFVNLASAIAFWRLNKKRFQAALPDPGAGRRRTGRRDLHLLVQRGLRRIPEHGRRRRRHPAGTAVDSVPVLRLPAHLRIPGIQAAVRGLAQREGTDDVIG